VVVSLGRNSCFSEALHENVLHYELPDCPKLSVTFTGKAGGMVVAEGMITGSAHGGRIELVAGDYQLSAETIDRADGYVTRQEGVKLISKVADCATVLLVHPQSKTFGLAHAGWRGTCANAAENLVKTMCENFSLPPGELQALVTPYADGQEYYVGVKDVPGWINVYAEFQKVFPPEVLKNIFVPHQSDEREAYLDIGLALQYQLGRAGILPENTTVSKFRTMSDDLFWSARLQFPPEKFIQGVPRPPLKHNIMCAYMK